MYKNISHYFLQLLTISVLLAVTLIGSMWFWDTYGVYRRDVDNLRASYIRQQRRELKRQVEFALAHIAYIRSQERKTAEAEIREQINITWKLADSIYRQGKNTLSPEQLAALIGKPLGVIRSPYSDFSFILNRHGIQEFFAWQEKTANGVKSNNHTIKDQRFIQKILRLASKDGTLHEYTWTTESKDKQRSTHCVVFRFLPALDWVIGTGMSTEGVDQLIQKKALSWLEHYRWGRKKNNYIFAGQWDGLSLTKPAKGKNMLEVTDPNGVHIVKELIRQAKNGGGFVQYVMPRLSEVKPAPKLSYAAPIKQWQWYVGTGVYVDEIEAIITARRQQLKQEFFHHLTQIGILLLLLSTVCVAMVLIVGRRVKSNLAPFADFFHQASSNFVQIQEDKLNFDEFRLLARDANAMLQERDKIQEILRNQEQLLNAMTRAGHQLLSGTDPDHAVTEALAILGKACGADRVYLFEVEQKKGAKKIIKLRYEWTDNVSRRMEDSRFQHISQTLLKSRLAEELRQGRAVQRSLEDLSGEAAELSREYGVKSILMLPVIYRGRFWGMLGCDACKAPIYWPENSVHSLQNFASTLCTAIMQRRSEQEATRIRDQWITTFNSIRDAIFLLDTENRIINANVEALRVAGVNDLAAIHGRNLPNILHGKGKRFKACLAELTLEQGIPLSDEVHSTKLGKFFFSSSFPVYHQEGNLAGVIYIARDVTREKNMERQLIQARKMEALGTLAGGIAHDFNNILAAIMGFSELALVKLQHETTDGLKDDLGQILRAGKRAKDLVAQLLAFSRSRESRKVFIKVTPIIQETIHMLKAFVPANIQVTTQLKPETRNLFADPTALHQVFMNLGSNAAQAMKNKGGLLVIKLEEIRLSREQRERISNPAGSYLHVSFSDQGGGIDPGIVDKIYDPFFTTKEVGEGTGMGLAAVHGIVEDHDGFMELENKPGTGAVFHIYLPQTSKTDTQQIPSAVNRQNTATRTFKKILIVDDEAMLLAMYKDMFSLLGCDTLTTAHPKDALQLLRDNPDIDLLCTDYDMPEMNGFELARQIRRIRPNLPILLNSGLTVNLDGDSIQKTHISKILTKPITLQDLQKALLQLAGTDTSR